MTDSILRPPYLLTSVGSWSLVFLSAFEAMAVTTVMPVVTAELDGRSLYAAAFSATLAASVVGLVVTGAWADRRGPVAPLLTSVGLFAAGLVLAGAAPVMVVFVAARLLQGLGAGGLTVAIYVLIARLFPAALHIKIFGAFASAWVLPALVGPFVAGVVADAFGWRWVFLGVVALVAAATALMLRATGTLHKSDIESTDPAGPTAQPGLAGSIADARRADGIDRVAAAVIVALSVVTLSYGTELPLWIVPLPLLTTVLALRRLLPRHTLRAAPGLPATVLLCGAAAGVFLGTEVHLPLLLQERYGLPPWLSGVTLTASAVSWAAASSVQARLADRLTPGAALRAGALLLAAGTGAVLVAVAAELPPAVVAAGWAVAGSGMGTLYPRISTLVLARSAPGREGFNTAAKSIADVVGCGVTLAVAGLVFAGLGPAGAKAPYVGVLILTSVLAVGAIVLAIRAGQGRESDCTTPRPYGDNDRPSDARIGAPP